MCVCVCVCVSMQLSHYGWQGSITFVASRSTEVSKKVRCSFCPMILSSALSITNIYNRFFSSFTSLSSLLSFSDLYVWWRVRFNGFPHLFFVYQRFLSYSLLSLLYTTPSSMDLHIKSSVFQRASSLHVLNRLVVVDVIEGRGLPTAEHDGKLAD